MHRPPEQVPEHPIPQPPQLLSFVCSSTQTPPHRTSLPGHMPLSGKPDSAPESPPELEPLPESVPASPPEPLPESVPPSLPELLPDVTQTSGVDESRSLCPLRFRSCCRRSRGSRPRPRRSRTTGSRCPARCTPAHPDSPRGRCRVSTGPACRAKRPHPTERRAPRRHWSAERRPYRRRPRPTWCRRPASPSASSYSAPSAVATPRVLQPRGSRADPPHQDHPAQLRDAGNDRHDGPALPARVGSRDGSESRPAALTARTGAVAASPRQRADAGGCGRRAAAASGVGEPLVERRGRTVRRPRRAVVAVKRRAARA